MKETSGQQDTHIVQIQTESDPHTQQDENEPLLKHSPKEDENRGRRNSESSLKSKEAKEPFI